MSNTTTFQKDQKKVITGWAFFDWANSAYSLTITVAIFPAYFLAVTDKTIHLGSISMSNSTLYSYAISTAYLLIAIASPFLSGIADYGGRKKFFLRMFTTIGSLACISLWFFNGMETLALGTISFILATIGFAGGLVFYNSYLPIIASEEKYDSVSAKGFAYGFIGSVILLLINLLVIQKYEWFGIAEESIAVKLSFVTVGLWWLGFAQIPFRRLPKDVRVKSEENLIFKGFQELKKVWNQLSNHVNTKRFLRSFFFYSAGTQTVLFLAATFAETQLNFGTLELIGLILLLQIVAIGGAYLFASIADKRGNKTSIMIMLLIWMFICVSAFFVYSKPPFYLIASLVGIVMGGIQSVSRATYSKLIPEDTEDTASWFSFYDVVEKLAIIVGTFSFGLIEQLTGSMHNSILSLAAFFIISFVLFRGVQIKHQID